MSPITHFLGSWLVASVVTDNPRDRKLVTLAGVLPDADGPGLIAEDLTEALPAVYRRLLAGLASALPRS